MKRFRLKTAPKQKAAPAPAKKLGRPTSYKPENARMARAHCQLGATDVDLANLFGVSTWTIASWGHHYPAFRDALRDGKASWDDRVERSLAQRAIGYSVDTEEIKVTKDGEVLRIPVRKHFAPDVTACIFWLKNRRPENWRDVYNYEHKGQIEDKTAAELLEEIKKDVAELGISAGVKLPQGVVPLNGKGTRH